MKAEPRIGRHIVGDWNFMPASGELRRRTDVRRLEPRAARTLQLLCEADGEIVTHEQLIGEVWNGRSLSDNSVAVVIGQLRRALDDDAREPRLIETIPKRGYRLIACGPAPQPRPSSTWIWLLVAAFLLALVPVALLPRVGHRPAIVVSDVTNATGQAQYDPLARATSELIVAELSKRGFDVKRGEGDGLRLQSKLVMWNGAPSLGMTATDAKGLVRWSAMTNGSAAEVPRGVARKLDAFSKKVKRD